MRELVKSCSHRFWEWIDSRSVVRRGSLIFTFYMTYWVMNKMVEYAMNSTLPGLEIAAVVTAIQVPITALQGYVIKAYFAGRNESSS